MAQRRRPGDWRTAVCIIALAVLPGVPEALGATLPQSPAASEARSTARDEPPVRDLASLIERVKANESKYRQLETFVRRTGTFVGRRNSTQGAVAEDQEKVHTVIQVGDLREVVPGVWFPHRHWSTGFKTSDLSRGRLAVMHRTDYSVQSIELNPAAPAEKFSEFIVPAGTEIMVQDRTGRHLGTIVQEADETPEISREKYRGLVEKAREGNK